MPGQKLEGTMLTVIGPTGTTWRMIRCRCDCGNEFVATYGALFYGKYSCGCRRRNGSMFHSGERVLDSMLTVIGPFAGSWSHIQCLCDCGKEVVIRYQNLRTGQYSCGCQRRLRECVFKPGERLPDTMLTVIGPEYSNSWSYVRCLCDCGAEIVVSYQRLRSGKYSCGCKRKLRPDMADHTGWTTATVYGNDGRGRKLTILYFDPESQQWVYLCHCCAEVFQLPRGARRGVQDTLHELAGAICPNFLGEFVPAFYANDRLSFTSGGGRMVGAECLARKLEERGLNKFVKRDYKGALEGFYVPSDGSFPQIRIEVSEMKAMVEREPELLKLGLTKPTEPPPVKQVIDEDAEGFAELDKTGAED